MKSTIMKILGVVAVGAGLFAGGTSAMAADAATCQKVRLSDVGWTDITAITAMAAAILEPMGYQGEISQLAVPVTYASMKNKDIDVFLGNWMPSMENDIKAYREDGSVETIGSRSSVRGAS